MCANRSMIPLKAYTTEILEGQFSEPGTISPKCENVLKDVFVRMGHPKARRIPIFHGLT